MNFFVKRTLPSIFLILLAGIIVYSNTLEAPFTFDDQHSIIQNKVVESPGNVLYGYKLGLQFVLNRPISYLTFALNYQFGGLDVTGYHVVNLIIHLMSALLVYAVLRLTFYTPFCKDRGLGTSKQHSYTSAEYFIPLFAALLFVVHPIQTQAVTYIVQRMASLATLFYLLSVVLYIKARVHLEDARDDSQQSSHRIPILLCYAGSILAAILAMKTKEIAFTLPLAILLYELFFFRGAWLRRLLYLLPLLATLPIIPLTILGLLDIGVNQQAALEWQAPIEEPLRVQTSIPRLDYIFTQLRVMITYLRLMIFPINQNIDYDYPVFNTFMATPVFLSFLLVAGLIAFAIYLFFISRNRLEASENSSNFPLRLIAFGILWVFLTLSVESSLIPIKDVIMEHRIYLPFFGAAATLSACLYLLVKKLGGLMRDKILLLVASSLVLTFGVAAYQRNQVWRNSLSLWQDAASKSPQKARPLNNYGQALEEAGRRNEAAEAFSKAIKVEPGYYKAYYNLADLYLVSDQPETALKLLQSAIRIYPEFTDAYVSIGAAFMRAGKFRQVTIFLEQNLERVAEKAEARFYLGAAYAFTGNRVAALRELDVLSRLDAAYANNLKGLLGISSKNSSPHGQAK